MRATVIPSLRSALKWVGSRLAIKLPDLQDKRLLALETDVFQKRAKMIKEAIAMPFEVVQAMEKFVCSGKEPAAARIFAWWLLCMVFASLRFDKARDEARRWAARRCLADEGRKKAEGDEVHRSKRRLYGWPVALGRLRALQRRQRARERLLGARPEYGRGL